MRQESQQVVERLGHSAIVAGSILSIATLFYLAQSNLREAGAREFGTGPEAPEQVTNFARTNAAAIKLEGESFGALTFSQVKAARIAAEKQLHALAYTEYLVEERDQLIEKRIRTETDSLAASISSPSELLRNRERLNGKVVRIFGTTICSGFSERSHGPWGQIGTTYAAFLLTTKDGETLELLKPVHVGKPGSAKEAEEQYLRIMLGRTSPSRAVEIFVKDDGLFFNSMW